MIRDVKISSKAKKQLLSVPFYIKVKLQDWVEDIEQRGLGEVRKIPGFHDEPCKGKLKELRSIRLSKGYRAYYRILKLGLEFVFIERVDKHEY